MSDTGAICCYMLKELARGAGYRGKRDATACRITAEDREQLGREDEGEIRGAVGNVAEDSCK